MAICPRCGAAVRPDALGCQQCGLPFQPSYAPSAPAWPPQPPMQQGWPQYPPQGQPVPNSPSQWGGYPAAQMPNQWGAPQPQQWAAPAPNAFPNPSSQWAPQPAQLFDESNLPEWMRQGGQQGYGGAQGYGAAPAYGGPVAPGAYAPPTGQQMYQQAQLTPGAMSAGSLIDNQALPGWINSNVARPQTDSQSGMAAASLLDESSLPQWLRNNPDTGAVPPGMGATPGWGGVPAQPMMQQPQPQPGEEALPNWLAQVVNGGPVPPPDPYLAAPQMQAPPPQMQVPPQQPMASQPHMQPSPGTGLGAGELPPWLQPQNGRPEPPLSAPIAHMAPRQPAANSEWLTDQVAVQVNAQMAAQGYGGNGMGPREADLPDWLMQDQGAAPQPQPNWQAPEDPLPTGDLPEWLVPAGNGRGGSDDRSRAGSHSRWGDERQGYDEPGEEYDEWEGEPDPRSRGQSKGMFGRHRRK